MHKIAFFPTTLLLPCISFTGLLSSNSLTTPVNEEYKQQLMGSPVYIQIFKEKRTLNLYVRIDEQYRSLDNHETYNYSGGLGPKQHQDDFRSSEGFCSVQCGQLKPDSRFYKTINIGFPSVYDRTHGYEGKYLMAHDACAFVDCYVMTDSGIGEIFQLVTGVLVLGQSSVQVSTYSFRVTDANMRCHKFSYYKDFWAQLKSRYDYFERTRKPPTVSAVDGCYVVSEPLSHEMVQPQLVSNYALPETK